MAQLGVVKATNWLFDYAQIPPHMQEGIYRYVNEHIPVGSFLEAVISNDLSEAVGCADSTNIRIIPVYVSWFYNHAPRDCWGSPEKYQRWIEGKS